MKKYLLVVAFFLLHIGCTQIIYAQTLPATLTVSWDPNPASENVTSYDLTLDGVVTPVPNTPNAQNKIQTTITVNSYGHHNMSLVAKSVSLACDDPTQCSTISIQSSPPLPAGFTLSAAPSKPVNGKTTKP